MVARVIQIKLRTLGNTFRRRPWQLVGVILGLLYTAVLVSSLLAGSIGLLYVNDVNFVSSLITLVGSVIVLAFFLVPLFFGSDDTLDPRAFSLIGVSTKRLALGLGLAAFLGIPAIAIAAASAGTLVTWSRDMWSCVLAIVCWPIVVATCVLGSRLSTSLAAFLLSTRRARELTGFLAIGLLMGLFPVIHLIASSPWTSGSGPVMTSASDVASWTPFGAAWAVPGTVARGEWLPAMCKLGMALATVVILSVAWKNLLGRMLTSPAREASTKSYFGLGWFDHAPARPAGAIAARSATYWQRDGRYWVSWLLVPFLPFVMIAPLVLVGLPERAALLLPLPIMCAFLGWVVHNDTAYDGTAIWLHLAAGTSGFADRIGRIVPPLLLGIPMIIVGSTVTMWLYKDWTILPAFVGICANLLLAGLGLSSVTSARFPYPVPRPGESAFTQPPGSGTTFIIVQSLTFVSSLVLTLPTVGLATLGLLVNPLWHIGAFVVGLGGGIFVLLVGISAGAHVFSRRAPEILAFALRS
jgi:ABC-2 type transport system permease protein